MYPSSKENNHRHPNKDVGMGKLPDINKRKAYFYSELKGTWTAMVGGWSEKATNLSTFTKAGANLVISYHGC